jgi:arabinofuranosyltransferase
MPLSSRTIYLSLLLIAAAIGILAFYNLPWWTVDDAFISYRYGHNLVRSGELTWNPGGAKVEGYTGILLPLLSGAFIWLGLPMVDGIKILGVVSLLVIVLLSQLAMHRLQVDLLRCGVSAVLLLATPLLYLHSISGLETIFFTAALTAVAYALADQAQLFATGKSGWALGAAMLVAGLCRPEGIALAVVVVAHLLLSKNKFNSLIFKHLILRVVAVGLIPLLIYWVWRASYYGAWMPNSYFAKRYDGWVNPASLWALAKFIGYYCLVPIAGSLLLGGWPHRSKLKSQTLLLSVGAVFFLCCTIAYLHSNLWMNYGSRFFFPFLPWILIAVSTMSGTATTATTLPRWKMMAIGALLLLQMGAMGFRFHQEWAFLNYYHWIVQDELIPVGKYLKAHLPDHSKVISFMDAGAVGYYSELEIVDFGRLSDAYLATQHPDQAQVANYFFAQKASAVVMSSTSGDTIAYIDEAMGIVNDARFQGYAQVATWGNRVEYPYWQHVFLLSP